MRAAKFFFHRQQDACLYITVFIRKAKAPAVLFDNIPHNPHADPMLCSVLFGSQQQRILTAGIMGVFVEDFEGDAALGHLDFHADVLFRGLLRGFDGIPCRFRQKTAKS